MPSSNYVTHSRYEEALAQETLLAHIPARVISKYFDRIQGWRNTKTSNAASAYIIELQAAKLRLEVENGWLTEDVDELTKELDKVKRELQERKKQDRVLHGLLEERMKADEEGAREGLDDVSMGDDSADDAGGENIKQ